MDGHWATLQHGITVGVKIRAVRTKYPTSRTSPATTFSPPSLIFSCRIYFSANDSVYPLMAIDLCSRQLLNHVYYEGPDPYQYSYVFPYPTLPFTPIYE